MRGFGIFGWLFVGVLVVCLSAAETNANPAWYNDNPAVKPGIPDIGWVSTDPLLVGHGGYCGYVAAANVITYWDSHGLSNLVEDGRTADQLMSDLIPYLYQAGTIHGTSCDELETGLRSYFTDKGYGWMAIKQYNPPNISQSLIEWELKKCEQVIVGTETHWLTAAGWWYEEDTMETWLGFYDPNPLQGHGKNFGGKEDYYMTSSANYLSLLYGSWTDVDNIITISVPDPASLTLALLGLSTVAMLRRRKELR